MYKVCFVDDETINYQLFEKMVPWEEKGFQIVGTAADGLEALQMYERLQPDLIFMDIQLPLLDGLECVRCIREENQDVQIVIVSAYSDFCTEGHPLWRTGFPPKTGEPHDAEPAGG